MIIYMCFFEIYVVHDNVQVEFQKMRLCVNLDMSYGP